MRKTLLHLVAVVILAGMLGGHISELLDHWDHTLKTGQDVDYTVVVMAACLGVVFAVGRKMLSVASQLLRRVKLLEISNHLFVALRTTPLDRLATGPPISLQSPLRI
ncbi:MAG: hypothetical protein ROO76_09395 [Terriglobia bacterium]|jgi:hypothetical protein|nr:hypothetical protein [Terriglobia bacterium]